MAMSTFAQDASSFAFKFYGRLRADVFYNSRANVESVDGLFYMYPKDKAPDADGKDLNAGAQGSFYAVYTRVGVDMTGPVIMGAKSSAKIEADFRGTGSTLGVVRLRHAYINLNWGKWALLMGQTWHPLYGEVAPSVLNLNTGAPFQPFGRAPQIRLRYLPVKDVTITLSALAESQYTSAGPAGKSADYLKNSCIPELYLGADYARGKWRCGVGAEMISLRPRKQSEVDGKTYRVSERATSYAVEAHAAYTADKWKLSGKTIYAGDLSHCSSLGGFAATAVDPRTGEMSYAPFRHSLTWLNFTYGKKWQPGLFAGYIKNLGTGKEIKGTTWGSGNDVDEIANLSAQLTYNLPHWRIGVELTACRAWYGSIDKANGKVKDTHGVTNLRSVLTAIYSF